SWNPPPARPRVPAVRATVDGHLGPVGPALPDDVVDRVDQVVVHFGAPLVVAGGHEVLAVPGRAPVVDLDTQVTAVGQPLGLGIPAPLVPDLRPAVHVDHRGQVPPVGAGRERQVPVDGEAVAGGEAERLHGRPLVALQLGPGVGQ